MDILVNNAWGGGEISRVEHKTETGMARALAVGFYGPFWAMGAALPLMKANGWGRVINMCSLNGVNAHMGTVEYNSAKEALRAATRTAAREWAGLEASSYAAHMRSEMNAQLLVRMTTRNFEEAVLARSEKRPPVFED